MLVECARCGAPLDVAARDVHLTCRYCGATQHVPAMKTLARETPRDWIPPAQWSARPPPAAAQPAKNSLRIGVVLAVVVFALVATIVVLTRFIHARSVEEIGRITREAALSVSNATASEPPAMRVDVADDPTARVHGDACLLDANRDDARDVAVVRGLGAQRSVAVLSGRDGALLWEGPGVGTQAKLVCLSAGKLVVIDGTSLAVFDTAARTLLFQRATPARVRTVGEAVGCIAVRAGGHAFSGARTFGYRLPGGENAPCGQRFETRRVPVEGKPSEFQTKRVVLDDVRWAEETPEVLCAGRRTARASSPSVMWTLSFKSRSGNPLAVTASDARGRVLAERELGVRCVGVGIGRMFLANSGDDALVLGARGAGSAGDVLVLSRLRSRDGIPVWERTIEESHRLVPRFFGTNGPFVVLQSQQRVDAYDVERGERAWSYGGL